MAANLREVVTPVGFETNIADLRGRPPKPLEDGAIKLLSLSRQLGFLGHGLSINFAAPILVLPSLAHMRVNNGMLTEFFKLFSFNLTYILYQIFLIFSNERSLRVSNATNRTELVSYFLSRQLLEQGQLPIFCTHYFLLR